MTIQKILPRKNNGNRNIMPCPNPQNMGILSFSVFTLNVMALRTAPGYVLSRCLKRCAMSPRLKSVPNLFQERCDISFYSFKHCDTSLYSYIRHGAFLVAGLGKRNLTCIASMSFSPQRETRGRKGQYISINENDVRPLHCVLSLYLKCIALLPFLFGVAA